MTIGEAIKSMREERGMSRNKLAIASGLAIITIQSYEQGRRVPNLDAYSKLSAAFGLSPGGILDRVRN